MVDSSNRRFGLIAIVAVAVIAIDQLTKAWAVSELTSRDIAVVWTLRLNLAKNTGAAFSVGRGNEITKLLPLVVLVGVLVFVARSRTPISRLGGVSVGMIVGGAMGNLADRALRTNGGAFLSGGVIDFIDFQWWPVFNVADMAVVVGGILFVLANLWAPGPPDDDAPTTPEADSA